MKIKPGFMLRKIVDNWVVVPVGERVVDFNGLITLSETGAFLWDKLQNDLEKDMLIKLILEEYDVDYETASSDVDEFIHSLVADEVLET